MIVPFGSIPKEVLDFLQIELARRFGSDVRIAGTEPLPRGEFNKSPLGRGLRDGFVHCLTKNIEILKHLINAYGDNPPAL